MGEDLERNDQIVGNLFGAGLHHARARRRSPSRSAQVSDLAVRLTVGLPLLRWRSCSF